MEHTNQTFCQGIFAQAVWCCLSLYLARLHMLCTPHHACGTAFPGAGPVHRVLHLFVSGREAKGMLQPVKQGLGHLLGQGRLCPLGAC